MFHKYNMLSQYSQYNQDLKLDSSYTGYLLPPLSSLTGSTYEC
jgi:hypothetical protein